jgi:16S rRNA processing protein RimM
MCPAVEAEFPDDAVEVGRITGAWGVKGWVRVDPYAADPQALYSTKRWFLRPPDPLPAGPVMAWPTLLRVVQAREHGSSVVAAVQGVEDRSAAQALRGARVYVSRASFPTPDAGEYYWVDLIGLAVVNRQGETLGEVEGLLETGAHAVLRVRRGDAELLIPFVDAYVDRVDLAARKVCVDWGPDY